MNTTTHLARHILQFQPNKDAARLCFYHYLVHYCDPDTPLTGQLIENFARRALVYKHWREQRVALSQEIQYVLQHYNETFMLDWNFKEISFPDNWQVVQIESRVEALHIIENWVEESFPENSNKRVFYTKGETFLVLVQTPEGELIATELNPQMLIRKGQLVPLCTDLRLTYTSNLELKPKVPQMIQVAGNTVARFYHHNNAVEGLVVRGYVFQKQQQFKGLLNRYPALYYPLKRLENYFIDRKSDPTYIELVETLEKAVELVRMQHPEARNFAEAALDRGQTALDTLFSNDNTIQILVNELKKFLSLSTGSLSL